MKQAIYIVLLMLLSGVGLKAQTTAVAQINAKKGVSIQQNASMQRLMQTDSTINAKRKGFVGYRIQIFTGGSSKKEEAFAVKAKFLELFPNERAYVVYTIPDFRVRVGNFRTKIEATGLYKSCLKHFPNSYPVKTVIKFDDLIPEVQTDSLKNDNIETIERSQF